MVEDLKELPIAETPELEKALSEATTSQEISAVMWAEAERQGIRREGANITAIPADTTKTPEVKTEEVEDDSPSYKEDFEIGGQTYHFEGASTGDILRQIKAATAAHNAATAPVKKETPVSKALSADDKVALELDYKMGKISLDDYLEKTGTIDAILEKRGIKVEELKKITEGEVRKSVADAWNAAADEFKAKNPEYVGSPQNMKLMGYKLAELGLGNAPTAESLTKAFEALKTDELYFVPVKTVETPVVKKKPSGSGLFGVSGNTGKETTTVGKQVALPTKAELDRMSPQEIMRAFNETAKEAGLDPNEVLLQSRI